jgi:hypothetical protein
VVIGLLALTSAHATSCDPEMLARAASGDFAYRNRGDRCEGFVKRRFGAGVYLDSVSSYVGDLDYGARATLAWALSEAGTVNVRVSATKLDVHYQMDARVAAPNTRFSWPMTLVGVERIEPQRLRLAVWDSRRVGDDWVRVYLPASLDREGAPPRRQERYRVTLWTEQALAQVYSTLERLSAKGALEQQIRVRHPEGSVPADAQLDVMVDVRNLAAGLYRLTLHFDTKDGLVAPLTLHLRHGP